MIPFRHTRSMSNSRSIVSSEGRLGLQPPVRRLHAGATRSWRRGVAAGQADMFEKEEVAFGFEYPSGLTHSIVGVRVGAQAKGDDNRVELSVGERKRSASARSKRTGQEAFAARRRARLSIAGSASIAITSCARV